VALRAKKTEPPGPETLGQAAAAWPARFSERLGDAAPPALYATGPIVLLTARRTALFCSARTPGDAILRAHDAARHLRDDGATVISGFHSPLEKECLRILLRGKQPIIICPARAIDRMRITGELRPAFEAGRLLVLSPFEKTPRRVTKESAWYRNQVVAALSDEAFIAHITPGGQTERLAGMLREWGVPILDR